MREQKVAHSLIGVYVSKSFSEEEEAAISCVELSFGKKTSSRPWLFEKWLLNKPGF
jgi:hypothetical protein